MEKQTKLLGYRIDESNFKMNPVKPNEKFTISPRFSCTIKGNPERFSASLSVDIGEAFSGSPTPFDLRAVIVGNFLIGEDVGTTRERQIRAAVDVLFPYLRAFVSTLTSVSGIPPFILPFLSGDAMVNGMHNDTPTEYN